MCFAFLFARFERFSDICARVNRYLLVTHRGREVSIFLTAPLGLGLLLQSTGWCASTTADHFNRSLMRRRSLSLLGSGASFPPGNVHRIGAYFAVLAPRSRLVFSVNSCNATLMMSDREGFRPIGDLM